MNQQDRNILFALLRKTLSDKNISWTNFKQSFDWKSILHVIEQHSLQNLLTNTLISLPQDIQFPKVKLDSLKQQSFQDEKRLTLLNECIASVFQILQKNGFHPILLKGPSLIDYYDNPSDRNCEDAEIYVGSDYDKVCTLLPLNQFDKMEERTNATIFSYQSVKFKVLRYIEVVTLPQNNEVVQTLAEFWSNRTDSMKVGETTVSVLSMNYLPVYLFMNAWQQFKEGKFKFLQLCDLTKVLNTVGDQLVVEELKDELSQVGLLKEWQIIGTVLTQLLGLPEEQFPLYKKYSVRQVHILSDLLLDKDLIEEKNPSSAENNVQILSLKEMTKKCCRLALVSLPVAIRTYWGFLKFR